MSLDPQTFHTVVLVWTALAVLSGAVLFFIPAPYGRYAEAYPGRTIAARWGWLLMESPAVLVFGAMYCVGDQRGSAASLVFLALWLSHYVQRAFVYPFLLPGKRHRMPVVHHRAGIWFQCDQWLSQRALRVFTLRRLP